MSQSSYTFILARWKKSSDKISALHWQIGGISHINQLKQRELFDVDHAYHVIAYGGNDRAIGTGCISESGLIPFIWVDATSLPFTVWKTFTRTQVKTLFVTWLSLFIIYT